MTPRRPAAEERTDDELTKEEERRIREAALDKTLAESFPASDPPSTLPNPLGDNAVEDAHRAPAGKDPSRRPTPRR